MFAAALRLVPRDWRDGVARDLAEEPGTPWQLAVRAAAIGIRLRAARTQDALRRSSGTANAHGRISIMRDFTRDVAFAARGAIRRPAYSLAVIATLAIGIGANTAIYSVFNWVLFRPVPGVVAPGELVTVRFVNTASSGVRFFVSYRDVADLRDGVTAFSTLGAASASSMNVVFAEDADPERVEGEIVTGNYFDVLGVTPREGRRFTPAEDRPGTATPAAIVSETLRRRVYGTGAALGRTLTINGRTFVIVGIMPSGFHGQSLVAATDLWIPIGAHAGALSGSGPDLLTNRRRSLFIDAVGRLRPGASLAQARDQAAAVAAAVPEFGGRRLGRGKLVPHVSPGIGLDVFAAERLRTVWWILAAAVALVLLLACANAANLLLARALARRREIAVCQAIGASRLRLIREQCAEGLVLALIAGAVGLAIGQGLVWMFDGMRIVSFLPAIAGVAIDWRVGVFTAAVAAATGVAFSLAPAIASSRLDLQASLKDGVTGSRRERARLRASMVAIQIAVGVVLLVAAGLFARTLHNIRALDLGVNLEGLSTFAADPTKLGYDEARAKRYFEDLLERLRGTPGIEAAGFAWRLPYSLMASDTSFTRAGDDTPHSAETDVVSPGYFRALGVPLLAGRDFTEGDRRQETDAAGVVIVSQKLARDVFPAGDAVGSRLVLKYPEGKVAEVVGVVGDVRGRPVTNEPEPFLYTPGLSVWGSVAVRSSLPFRETAAAIRAAARDLDPSLPPYDLEPMTAGLDRVISEQRLLARLGGIFGVAAALLAAVGVYGMMAGSVAERRREFGIRVALGARAAELLGMVIASAARTASIGLALGLLATIAAMRGLESRLYGVTRSDPLTLLGAGVGLFAVAVAASLLPALRASRVDPVRSLRVE